MKSTLALILLLTMVALLGAETFNPLAFRSNVPSISLLNPNKMTMTHSMSFSSGMSSNGLGYYSSAYTNHILYQFNPRLKLNLDLNFVNRGTMMHRDGLQFDSNDDNNTRVLPDLQLQYNPTENTTIRFEFHSSSPYYLLRP